MESVTQAQEKASLVGKAADVAAAGTVLALVGKAVDVVAAGTVLALVGKAVDVAAAGRVLALSVQTEHKADDASDDCRRHPLVERSRPWVVDSYPHKTLDRHAEMVACIAAGAADLPSSLHNHALLLRMFE